MKKIFLPIFAAMFCGMSAYAAPGGTWTTIEHTAYPTPQNLMAELDGSKVKLSWDGVQWPADGFPEEIDGKTVPTDFSYEIECRVKTTGTDTWSEWWERTSRNRLDNNGVFVSRWEIEDEGIESGKTYQYRIRCYSYIEPENPQDLTNPTRDGYFSEYSDIVTAYRTLDKLEVASAQTQGELAGKTSVTIQYTYASSREAEGDEPLYFTFKVIEIPDPEPGTTPEAPVEGSKPYARRDGTPLTVQSLTVTYADGTSKDIDPNNFTLTASDESGTITWNAYQDLENYYHDNVTVWVQGWEKPETEGGEPRLVVDDAIGEVAIDTHPVAAKPTDDKSGILLTWPHVPNAVMYEVWRTSKAGESTPLTASTETTYTDTSAEEAEIYTYEIRMFDSASHEVGSVSVSGYRSLEKIEFVQARQFYPWTTQVAVDVYYKSARQSSTDGELTYGIKAKMADGTKVPIASENLHLETVNGSTLLPDDIPFGAPSLASGATTRIWWNAPADLATLQLPSSVLSGIVLQLVPTLAEGAPAGAQPAPAAVASAGVTVDLRTVRTVIPGEKIPVVWEWWRTDGRVEAHDKNVFYVKPESSETDESMVWHTPEHSGEGTIEVPENEDLWPSFRLVKREINTDDTDEAKQITLTSEVLFQMPAVAPQNVQATRGNTEALTVTWDPVPYAYRYQIEITTVNEGGSTTKRTQYVFDGTQYVDQRAPELGIVGYKVQACFPNNVTGEQSEQVVGWRSIDKVELKGVSTRRPWNGTVDIDLAYQTVRDQYGKVVDGATALPGKTVRIAVVTADGEAFAVQSLTRERLEDDIIRRETVRNGEFTLGANDRIVWDAPTDAPRMREPGCTLKVTLAGDEYSGKMTFEKTFDLDTRTSYIDLPFSTGGIQIPWSTRWAKPGATSLGLTDNWYNVATVLKDETDNDNKVELLNSNESLGNEGSVTWTPKKWGLNTITLTLSPASGDNERTEYTAIFNVVPDFTFTATQGNRDSIIVEWNELWDAHSYSIRRRAAHTDDAFAEVATCTDTTRWADTSEETIIGEFEYTIMPLTDDGQDAWDQFDPVVGYRALDIARSITIESNVADAVTTDKEAAKYGETVTLTITSVAGYAFEQIRAMAGETPLTLVSEEEGKYTFVMPLDEVVVTTTFRAIDYTITIEPAENGSVTADKETAHYGETVTLTITPATNYELEQLRVMSGETEISVENNTFVMPAGNVVITATYTAIYYDVILVPSVSGNITADKQTAHVGETVTLTATPDKGYELDEIHVMNGETQVATVSEGEGIHTFVMPAGSVVVSTTFKMTDYTITIEPNADGTVTADKETAHMGETVTLTIVPNEGYELEQLRVMNGETEVDVVASESGYTFTMPADDVEVSATFKTETGIKETTTTDVAPRKIIHNGEVFIICDGIWYDLHGRVRNP